MRNQWRHARLGSAAPQKKKKTSALLTTAAAAAARSTVGFIAGRIVEVSHRPEIKQAIIHILFGEGKIKVNPSFCSSWSSFGLGSVFSTWSRLRWLAGFWGSFFCLFFFLLWWFISTLHLRHHSDENQDLTSSSRLLTCDAGCSRVSNAMQTS